MDTSAVQVDKQLRVEMILEVWLFSVFAQLNDERSRKNFQNVESKEDLQHSIYSCGTVNDIHFELQLKKLIKKKKNVQENLSEGA